ncbi:DUF3427 domain-containing protein [Corynebacterium sp.]|uniref:DUF3427 domain-containing protein n=1 Tax=Corynebacterium sp. TaxID=1720 RepID=UPI0026DCFBCB|nr:DUF3427 domain-containing protein [Corynebacterium sp.]
MHDQHKNLVVAATGTGKTVVAALGYKRLCETMTSDERRPRLLFIAHRREILEQARRMYQEVLIDPTFGEIWGDGLVPIHGDYVFAMVQTLAKVKEPLDYDIVVLDELHHGFARSYRDVFSRLTYRELLGMTATPERMDGFNIKELFDGRIAYDLRLWDALESDLLSPFHYFGIADGTDLTGLDWRNGSYTIADLNDLYTGNEARLRLVLNAVNEKVADPGSMRALGFCVSVDHAEYMAEMFTRQGIASVAITGKTPGDARRKAFADLRQGRVQCLFSVDVFNEGLDIPKVDVLLMLRPTASATIFLQQLGRGLRRAEGKALTTVLDFVGNHRAEFDLAKRYEVMTGRKRKDLMEEVEDEFPFLPAGTRIVLDKVTQERVLASVKRTTNVGPKKMAALLASMAVDKAKVSLGQFLAENGFDLADVYKNRGSWSLILEEVGVVSKSPERAKAARRMSALVHVDDAARIDAYRRIATGTVTISGMSPMDQVYAHMLLATLYRDSRITEHEARLAELRADSVLVDEIEQIMDLRSQDHSNRYVQPMRLGTTVLPLCTHATYKREELLAAMGWMDSTSNVPQGRQPSTQREGVIWLPKLATDLFFVTLNKHHRHYSPTTMYEDYAVTRSVFHWQSQSTTSADSVTGRRYQHHQEQGTNVVLAVRGETSDAVGDGAPYVLAGPMDFISCEGEKPMSIEWKLHRPLPADLFEQAQVASV